MSSPPQDGATLQLAGYIASMRREDLDEKTVDHAKKLLLDGIGCLIAGTSGAVARSASRAFEPMAGEGGGPTTNLVTGRQTSARDAAFVNGVALYSIGLNDIHRPSISHPGGCIIPAILAVGQWKRSKGVDLLKAMTAGYEVMGRMGAAMQPSHWDRGFHPTGTFGTFGAAAAVSRLLDLDRSKIASAFGIAGSQAGGIQAYHTDGSLTMIYHAGRSAQNGVEAALLAQEGFTGPHYVFEDPVGYLALTSDNPKLSALTDKLGENLAINATSFRPYYGCTATIAASAAAEVIAKRRIGQAGNIRSVKIRVHPEAVKVIDFGDPQTLLAARISMQFNVAIVLDQGAVLMRDAESKDLRSDSVRRLIGVSKVVPDPEVSYWGSAVEVDYADGSRESVLEENPKGDPSNPMTWRDTEEKFLALTTPNIESGAEKIIEVVRSVEEHQGDHLVSVIARAIGHA